MKKRLRGSKNRKNLTENYTNLNTEADSLPYLDQSLQNENNQTYSSVEHKNIQSFSSTYGAGINAHQSSMTNYNPY